MRGNSYSKKHAFLDENSSREYWQFSFEEFGDFDIPNSIDYILKVTNKASISIIGLSQGTTSTFHSLVQKQEFYKDKINVFIALAPAITLNYTSDEFLVKLAE